MVAIAYVVNLEQSRLILEYSTFNANLTSSDLPLNKTFLNSSIIFSPDQPRIIRDSLELAHAKLASEDRRENESHSNKGKFKEPRKWQLC